MTIFNLKRGESNITGATGPVVEPVTIVLENRVSGHLIEYGNRVTGGLNPLVPVPVPMCLAHRAIQVIWKRLVHRLDENVLPTLLTDPRPELLSLLMNKVRIRHGESPDGRGSRISPTSSPKSPP